MQSKPESRSSWPRQLPAGILCSRLLALSSRADGAPNARTDTGWSSTGPRPGAPKLIEPSSSLGAAWSSYRINSHLPRSGNATNQLNGVSSETRSKRRPTSRINSAMAYSNLNRDCPAVTARSHGDHAPVSVKLGRNSGRSGTDDCESHRHSERAQTIPDHESLLRICRLKSLTRN